MAGIIAQMAPAAIAAISMIRISTSRNLIAQEDHAGGRGKRSDQDLSLSSQIPEPHAEGGGQSQRNAEQDGDILAQDPHAAGRAEGALEHGDIDLDRIETGGDHRDQRAQKQ